MQVIVPKNENKKISHQTQKRKLKAIASVTYLQTTQMTPQDWLLSCWHFVEQFNNFTTIWLEAPISCYCSLKKSKAEIYSWWKKATGFNSHSFDFCWILQKYNRSVVMSIYLFVNEKHPIYRVIVLLHLCWLHARLKTISKPFLNTTVFFPNLLYQHQSYRAVTRKQFLKLVASDLIYLMIRINLLSSKFFPLWNPAYLFVVRHLC